MSDPLSTAIVALGQRPGLDLIVHISSGTATALPAEIATRAEHILRIAPEPQGPRDLIRQSAVTGQVRIEQATIGLKPGRAPYHHLNLPMLSGLYDETGFAPLFPGLKRLATNEVHVLDGVGLLATADLKAGAKHGCAARRLLVCDVVQATQDLIVTLLACDGLTHFGQLLLRLPKAVWRDGAQSLAEVLALLEKSGFHPYGHWDDDPDFPLYQFRHVTQGQGAEVQAHVAGMQQRIEAAEARAKTAETAQAQSQRQLAEVQQDLTRALRLQSLREADLADLRQRHAVFLDTQDQQQQLIKRLMAQLEAAADYLPTTRDKDTLKSKSRQQTGTARTGKKE